MSSLEGTAPILPAGRRIVGWVSCGAASAVLGSSHTLERNQGNVPPKLGNYIVDSHG